jgi:hypothetical protein
VRFANLVSRFEHREWIQREADGNACCGTSQEIPRICQYGENGGMSFMVASADRREERRDGHEATDLAQASHVERDPRDVSGKVISDFAHIHRQ